MKSWIQREFYSCFFNQYFCSIQGKNVLSHKKVQLLNVMFQQLDVDSYIKWNSLFQCSNAGYVSQQVSWPHLVKISSDDTIWTMSTHKNPEANNQYQSEVDLKPAHFHPPTPRDLKILVLHKVEGSTCTV